MSKEYYEAHKEEIKERMKAYYEAHKEEIKTRNKSRRKAYYQANRDKCKEYQKAYSEAHKEERKEYQKNDTNSSGATKDSVRRRSSYYLFNIIKHSKLKNFEIHHCFGYENHKCFVYIPKELHLQIHQYLRDNGISADSNHFSQIVHLINAWNGYTYIKV